MLGGSSRTKRHLQAFSRWTAVSAVVLSPWLFGSAEPWAFLLICTLVEIACGVWVFSEICSGACELRAPVLFLCLIGLIGVVVLQMSSLPSAAVRALSPFSADMADRTASALEGWRLSGTAHATLGQEAGWASLSVSRPATVRSLYLLVAYVAVFLVMAHAIREWEHLQHAASVILFFSLIMTVLAIVHKFSGSDSIYWFHEPRYGGKVFGPFTNRNHLAAHLNMVFGIALGLFFSSRRVYQMLAWPGWRDRLVWLTSKQAGKTILLGFSVFLTAGAVALSLSRGALLSLAATLTLLAVIVFRRRKSGLKALMGFIPAMLLMVATIVWFGSGQLVARLGDLTEVARHPLEYGRFIVSRDTLRIFLAAPLFGSGFGTFRHVYPVFQTPDLYHRWLHAHNDWAQLLAEGGLIGSLAFLAAIWLWLGCIRRRLPVSSKRAKLLVLGMLFGLTTIAFHSFVDYSLHKPANAFLLSAMAGMSLAGVYIKRGGTASDTWPKSPTRGGRFSACLPFLVTLVALTTVIVCQQREWRGELAFPRFLYFDKLAERISWLPDREQAVQSAAHEADLVALYAYRNPDALTEITTALIKWCAPEAGVTRATQVSLAEKAPDTALLAVLGAPSDYLTWLSLSRAQMLVGRWDAAESALARARALVLHGEQVRMFLPPADEEESEEDEPLPDPPISPAQGVGADV